MPLIQYLLYAWGFTYAVSFNPHNNSELDGYSNFTDTETETEKFMNWPKSLC